MPHISLKQLAEDKEIEGVSKSVTTFQVDPRLIQFEDGFNGRPIDPDHVNTFKTTIRNGGHVPLIEVRVEQGKIFVVEGHHRVQAYRELIEEGEDIRRISAIEFKGNTTDRILRMVSSSQGKALTPLQKSVQYAKLTSYGLSTKEIADKTGTTVPHVSQLLKLAEAERDLQKLVEDGDVSAKEAIDVFKAHGKDAGKVIKKVIEESGGKKATPSRIKESTPKAAPKPRKTLSERVTDEEIEELASSFQALYPNATKHLLVDFGRRVLEEFGK